MARRPKELRDFKVPVTLIKRGYILIRATSARVAREWVNGSRTVPGMSEIEMLRAIRPEIEDRVEVGKAEEFVFEPVSPDRPGVDKDGNHYPTPYNHDCV